jgi:diguanylate cyclase (GGDEF)-like protein
MAAENRRYFHHPVICPVDNQGRESRSTALLNTSNADVHQPPSSLNSGRFLGLLVVQLVVFSLLLAISRQIYSVNLGFAAQHTRLLQIRQQLEMVSEDLSKLSQAAPGTAEQEGQVRQICTELNLGAAPNHFLSEIAAELPSESSDVEEAASGLNSAWERVRSVSGGQAVPRGEAGVYSAASHLWHTVDTLRNSVDRLDDASFESFEAFQNIRWMDLMLAVLNGLLILFAFVYAVQLHRRLRVQEVARLNIESELAAERTALERRVQSRTAALMMEVKERQRAESLNRGRNHALEMLVRNESAAAILDALASAVAEYRSSWLCVFHSVEGSTLKLVASSGLNGKVMQHFRAIPTSFADAPESVALASGKPHVILDLGQEHKPWSELLRANGLLSVWSAPFFAPQAGALGTLTVYTLLKWEPTSADIEMLESACHMAALVLERSRLQAQLIDHAYHDSLTGLPNRRLARDRIINAINRAARTGQGLAILWVDLDRFKQINDQYGHPVGDAVLQQTAQRLSERLRTSDTLARMGGDEFMAILEGTSSREAAEATANSLLEILTGPMQIDELELEITASIGISIYPEDGKTGDSLSQHADQAMYAAKFGSCGVRSFTPAMDREPAERRELEAELSHALETGGFTVAYQPLCAPDGALIGFEALLRFVSPRLGNVAPCEFIPVAEDTQLIVPLGEWVLREVCRQSAEWQEAGYPRASMGVNISALQFARDDFAETVAQILTETGYAPEMLVLELTESIVMRDFVESARQMERLKRLGVRIAIDDFGTGYSSLSYLHRLPIDVLKVDRSFIETLNEPEGTRPIVEAVLSMAHTLGLRVVAEGVETAEQLATLRRFRCDIIQGYFFSRPVPPSQAAIFLESGRLEPAESLISSGDAAVLP